MKVYSYLDYRRFLKDRFALLKRTRPGFSFRAFNRLAGGKSSAFLKLVIDGSRNLAEEGIAMIVRGFGLSPKEAGYFRLLVSFNQAANNEEKDRYFRQIVGNKNFISAKPLVSAQYLLFAHWYYVAIVEAVRLKSSVPIDANWLQRHIHPRISIKQVKQAIRDLEKLGLLVERPDGGYERRDPMLSTEDEVRSVAVAKFHSQMSSLAARSVMEDSAEDREFSALSVAVSRETFQRAKAEIQKFRRTLHSLLEQDDAHPKVAVAQLNIQLFKLTNGGGRND